MSEYPNCEYPASGKPDTQHHQDVNESAEQTEQQQLSLISQAVTRYLAQREHGFKELIQKLVQKGFTGKWVEQVVQEFSDRGWQSDERFATVMIKRRIEKGYGERFITAECQQKGLSSSQVTSVLDALETDWYAVAINCAQRKFGQSRLGQDKFDSNSAPDQKAQMKRYRFLIQRGFSSDIVRAVLDDLQGEQPS